MAQINTRIVLRNDSTLNWTANENVVLLKGEVGVEFLSNEKCKVKIGDGVKSWKDLEYFGGEQLLGDSKTIIINGEVISLKGFEEAMPGAQMRKGENGELEWFTPSTEAVDELNEAVAGLQADVSSLFDLMQPEGEASLPEKVQTLEELVNGTGEGSVDAKIEKAINDFMFTVTDNEQIDTVKEIIDYVAEHGKEFGIVLEKLDTIEEGAQVNTLEKITLAGVEANITDKTIDIPMAQLDKAGLVKSAAGANKVNVAADGTMSVSKVDINSIVVPAGQEVVLNGGSASGSTNGYVVSVGGYGFTNINDAIAHTDNGEVISLQENFQNSNSLVIANKDITLDLNNHNLIGNGSDGAIYAENGTLTLEGEGMVHGTLGADNYSMSVWARDAHVVINDGLYTNETDGSERGTDLIYASGNSLIEINGGVFEAANPQWTLNVKDVDYKAGRANIIVKGGSFKNFDPANCLAEGVGTNFVALGYQSVKEGDYYVVKPL